MSHGSSDVCSSDLQGGGEAPQGDGDRQPAPRLDAVEPAPDEEESDAVARLKGGDDIAVIDLAPPHVGFDHRLEHADHLTVDIVDRDDEEEQRADRRSEEHTSELQSLMRISYAVFCLKKKTKHKHNKMIQLICYSIYL